MTRLPLPGCWYGEACLRPDGTRGYWASRIPSGGPGGNGGVYTERGLIPTKPLLFTRGHPSGKFAGQSATDATGNLEYQESGGPDVPVGVVGGMNTVLYLRDGTLMQGGPQYGVAGLRYQADDGHVVAGDQSHLSPDGLLADYTELHHIRIGQDQVAGLGTILQVLDRPGGTGPRYILEPGAGTAIRFNFYPPDQLAVYVVKLQERQAVAIWLTLADIATLTPYPVAAPVPAPTVIGPKGASRPADGRLYDLGAFLVSDARLQPRSGPTHPQHQQQPPPGDLIHFVKFGNPEAYETWAYDDHWIYHLEDASGAPPYSFTDPRWWPRHLAIGEAHAFDTGPHEAVFRERATCHEIRRDPWRRRMWLHAAYDGWDWGPDLGIRRPTIMLVYDGTAGIHAADRFIEVYYFAAGAGWCRWEAYHSDQVYAQGPRGGASFTDAARSARSDFYRVGGPPVAVALTGCVPQVCHHLPAAAPAPIPVPAPPPTPVPIPVPHPTPRPPMSNENINPSYDEFINGPSSEALQVRAAYRAKHGVEPAIPDYYHNAWRRLRERWTLRDILHDILGEPLEDGGPGGADRGSL